MTNSAVPIAIVALASTSLASPIPKPIESQEDLKDAAIRIESHRDEADANTVSFKVTWTPRKRDGVFPPRMDLVMNDGGAAEKAVRQRLLVRCEMDANGRCHIDFSISGKELASAELVFRLDQQTEYSLRLSDHEDHFSACRKRTGDPFAVQPGDR